MNYKAILKGSGIALAITFAVISVVAVINYFCGLSEDVTRIITIAGLAAGVVFSSFGVSSACEKMKLFNAAGVGVCCLAVIMMLSVVVCGTVSFSMNFLTIAVCCIAASVLGAILG